MTKKLAVAVALLALIAACGGGSDSGGGGGTNPAPTSAKSVAADMKALNMAYQAYSNIAPIIFGGGAQVVKETSSDIAVECSDTSSASFSCTATDSLGGTCTVTGSATQATYTFEMAMNCTNFHPDSDTTIDGDYTATVIYHAGAAAMTTKNSGFLKLTGNKTTGDECTIEDNDTSIDDGTCTEGGTCEASSNNLIVRLEFLVGSGGLTITDPCGTYSYSAGFNMSSNLCMTEGTTNFIVNFSVEGTQNGETANFSETWTCNYSNM